MAPSPTPGGNWNDVEKLVDRVVQMLSFTENRLTDFVDSIAAA
jgi:hypothetical protein